MTLKSIGIIEDKFLNNLSLKCPEVGDNVTIEVKISEGSRERIQNIRGIVIATNNSGCKKTFTLRSFLQSGGVERIYHLQSPIIQKIEVTKKSKVRRSKLYFLRQRFGKSTRLPTKIIK